VIILDTDVLSIVQRADGQQYENLVRKLDEADEDVAVTIISFEEQMRGWLAYIARSASLDHQVKGYARLHGLLEDLRLDPSSVSIRRVPRGSKP
jgi:tRNA(fMet)-specific endonuclease VapC